MQKIIPHLWFDDKAEQAAKFYASIFDDSKVGNITRYNDEIAEIAGRPKGSVMTVEFELAGQQFYGLNGGPQFKFSEAISFFVNCDSQKEIDHLWDKLVDGGEEQPCGWLKDKYGLSWQIVPKQLDEMMNDSDEDKSQRVMSALLTMTKIDLATLEAAYNQK